ncbi:MAG: hypothetical protein A2Z91_02500 [Deltaproteobacteria bacterium GWA2_38_16]|nr:MAG: hypothetical protein A2Z91_02500 [Deltaproteobacteria bacterium GWA2_38_16]OGQ02064.1 MAG: hypothetical protein A3D19_08795 [Deltaproteobacteria bacterium RIFCSPHIGHO2_02_FULL_38_15]OGQ32550.1 MAG: hypothetical protein A3A72_03145 [Deltaproteobacteria bacterium RIFCSPLOWO2_01_FULL_38_9]OGQ64231.1 MAG: hypothetical protein A3G92_06475 [Deltaproteobacteria bacterium RIFCSPLOWO2_12_FULL_38_8]
MISSQNSFSQMEDFPSDIVDHPYKEGEILVRYLSATAPEERDLIRSQMGGEIADNHFIVPNLELVKLPQGQSVEEALAYYQNTPGVLYAVPNHLVYINGGIFPPRPLPDNPDPTPNPFGDPFFDRSYGISLIGSPKAWEQFTTGSREIVVGVIDTGIDYTHEDLAANIWKNPKEIEGNGIDDDNNGFVDDIYGWNFVGNNNNPFDDNRHGTHVSGTIGALAGNGLGTIGVSPKVSLMACKFLSKDGWGSIDAAIRSISYAVMNGAKVLNNSWGGGGYSQALLDAIKTAERAGVLFVAAAGNSNADNDKNPMYPASYDAANIVSVAATDYLDQRASFSSYGKTTVDLAAPGVAVFSTVPNNLYGNLSGTSMATPHVAGAAALIWAYKPALSMYDLKDLIFKTVDPVDSMKDITVTGGRLNVFNAMAFSLLQF